MNVKLEGYNGYGWKVCDTCPCRTDGECFFGYERLKGWLDRNFGDTSNGGDNECPEERGEWHYVTLRPQECYDDHGR